MSGRSFRDGSVGRDGREEASEAKRGCAEGRVVGVCAGDEYGSGRPKIDVAGEGRQGGNRGPEGAQRLTGGRRWPEGAAVPG